MKSKLMKVIFCIVIYLFPHIIFAANQVLFYEPNIVSLSGIIKIKAFPGAPNYESVEAGDDLESGPYLILSRPIDVLASTGQRNQNTESEKNLKIIQIVIGDETNWNEQYIDKQVLITGTLFHRLTGHHHTSVLINAEHFEVLKEKN